MTRASIPVDLLNPGQVFAALGFLEAANVLCSSAAGGFDWIDSANVRFVLQASGHRDPFEIVLEFLANARLRRIVPPGYKDPPPKKKGKAKADEEEEEEVFDSETSNCFPSFEPLRMSLPIRLIHAEHSLDITHWADGSSRNAFKLYAGNRSAAQIARAMLVGTREKPRKGEKIGRLKTKGIRTLWNEDPTGLAERPFDVLTPIGGSFNFDPRGAWNALGEGYSPDTQGHGVAASPVVELLATIGLEHARPNRGERTRTVYYAAWGELLNPLLARPALSGARFGVPLRLFSFELANKGRNNKSVSVAQEEI